jgi:hypothetical protein
MGIGVPRVTRVVRGDQGPFATTVDQHPTIEGLEVVMVGAQPVEQIEHGQVAVGPVDPVIVQRSGGRTSAPAPAPLNP